MSETASQLTTDAQSIWLSGVEAVDSARLVEKFVKVDGGDLVFGNDRLRLLLDSIRRILVVGGGKAGAGMARGLESVLGPGLLESKKVSGWINVPDPLAEPLSHIWLHGARPAGMNEPTMAGVVGSREILDMVGSLGKDDLCISLLSGGGSALLPSPLNPVSLDDKLELTRLLSSVGANIEELNTVRKQLSAIKGGGLLRSCSAGRIVSLILSDVLGDSLGIIASGPTVPETVKANRALSILDFFDTGRRHVPATVYDLLERKASFKPSEPTAKFDNFIIGNNLTAVKAAEAKAIELGYRCESFSATDCEGEAEQIGIDLAAKAIQMRDSTKVSPNCFISGGEPVVRLVEPSIRGRGGRNQQLILAALDQLEDDGADRIVLLSGGTDGEDGPTDAAGAFLDTRLLKRVREAGIDPKDYLRRNDAYTFFKLVDGLIETGPTDTNVCDLRVVLVDNRSY
jgi:glycerate 2-kinase